MATTERELVLRQRREQEEPPARSDAADTADGGNGGPPPDLVRQAEAARAAAEESLKAHVRKFAAHSGSQVRQEGADLPTSDGLPVSEAGTPITDYGYAYWDCLMYGPYQYQPFSQLPVRPNKVIRAGEWAMLWAVVWINPAFHLGNLPATQILGGRDYNAGFEVFNFSNVANGPDQRTTGQFTGPAAEWNWFPFWFRLPDPGNTPDIYEAVFTIDVVNSGLDLAAFATWHFDPDVELPFGPWAPRWRHDMPARFIAYRF